LPAPLLDSTVTSVVMFVCDTVSLPIKGWGTAYVVPLQPVALESQVNGQVNFDQRWLLMLVGEMHN
jgi:hypothetical protein